MQLVFGNTMENFRIRRDIKSYKFYYHNEGKMKQTSIVSKKFIKNSRKARN